MKFNLADKAEKSKAFSYFTTLANKKAMISLTKNSPGRTLKQNSYLHLLIGYFGSETGYDLEESKQLYKECSPTIYKYEKRGHVFWKSSADLTVDEMKITIDRFREAAAARGVDLPLATDQEWLRHIENQIEQSSYYLKGGR